MIDDYMEYDSYFGCCGYHDYTLSDVLICSDKRLEFVDSFLDQKGDVDVGSLHD